MQRFLLASALCLLLAPLAAPPRAGAVTRFVSPAGADEASGRLGKPLRTIGRAVELAGPGDLVVVAAGVYRESVTLSASGRAGAPIVLRGLPGAVLVAPDASTSPSAFDVRPGTAHVSIEGFEMSGYGEAVFVRQGASDVVLDGLYVHDNQTGIWIAGCRVVVRDSVVERHRASGIRIFAGARDVDVVDTRVASSDDGLGCDGDADGVTAEATTSGLRLERVESSGNSEDGFDLQGDDVVVVGAKALANGCTGVKLGASARVENLLVEGSRVGLSAGGAATLINVTLANNALGLRLPGNGQTVTMRNSIVSGPGKAISLAPGASLAEDHNLLYRPEANERLIERFRDDGGVDLYSADDVNSGVWQRSSGQGAATFAADPMFAGGGCRLSAASPALDSADDGEVPEADLDGASRPVGAATDRGAYEWREEDGALVLDRAALRAHPDGDGPAGIRVSLRRDAMSVAEVVGATLHLTLRGERAHVLDLVVPATAWRLARGARIATVQALAGGRTHVAVRSIDDRIELTVRAASADLWAAGVSVGDVTLDWGAVHAAAHGACGRARR